MRRAGHDPAAIEKRAARLMAQKEAAWEAAGGDDNYLPPGTGDMDIDMEDEEQGPDSGHKPKIQKAMAIDRTPRGNRQFAGLASRAQSNKAVQLRKFAQREPNRLAKASESDRHVPITRPKWMLAGKRKGGKTDRR